MLKSVKLTNICQGRKNRNVLFRVFFLLVATMVSFTAIKLPPVMADSGTCTAIDFLQNRKDGETCVVSKDCINLNCAHDGICGGNNNGYCETSQECNPKCLYDENDSPIRDNWGSPQCYDENGTLQSYFGPLLYCDSEGVCRPGIFLQGK